MNTRSKLLVYKQFITPTIDNSLYIIMINCVESMIPYLCTFERGSRGLCSRRSPKNG